MDQDRANSKLPENSPTLGRRTRALRWRTVVVACALAANFAAVRCLSWAVEKPSLPNPGQEISENIPSSLREDVRYLSSDELQGRGVGEDSIDVAANYIARRFAEVGLKTDLLDGAPFQPVEVSLGSQPGPIESNRLRVHVNGETEPFVSAALGASLCPLAIGTNYGRVQAPLAFVGYGIDAPEFSYSDYEGMGIKGCIVMILRKAPGMRSNNSPFSSNDATRHALFSTKIQTAIQKGASAVIFINDQESTKEATNLTQRRIDLEEKRIGDTTAKLEALPAEDIDGRATLTASIERMRVSVEELKLEILAAQRGVMDVSAAGRRRHDEPSVPVISLGRAEADQMIRAAGKDTNLEQWERKTDDEIRPNSFFLSGMVGKLQVEITPNHRTSNNVIGTFDGRGNLASQSIVIGAHYDHVGLGGFGSLAPGTIEVHNGADDNASGTAGLMAIASKLKERLASVDNHRRIIVIAFTGEERGLVGSQHYVRNPCFDLGSTVSMINLDMIGRLRDNELTVYGTGSGDVLDQVIESANVRGKFNLFKVPTGYGPSDHQSFFERGVPVLFFFTGLHQDYHRPSDDFDKINFIDLARITDTVCDVALDLSTRPQAPRHQLTTDKNAPIRRQMTVMLGVQLSDSDAGVMITGVTPGSTADAGGLKVGDRLDRIDQIRIKNSALALELLRNRDPGAVVRLQLTRQDQFIETTCRLESRP
jgi:Peptidase family M28/PDZ domain/PA domain